MFTHLTNCVRIWSLLVGLTKCAAHLGKRAAQLAKCARIWSTARAFGGQTRAQFTKRCEFDQMPRVWPIGQMRCAFGQMRRLVKCALHIYVLMMQKHVRCVWSTRRHTLATTAFNVTQSSSHVLDSWWAISSLINSHGSFLIPLNCCSNAHSFLYKAARCRKQVLWCREKLLS